MYYLVLLFPDCILISFLSSFLVSEKFNNMGYTSITEFVADIRQIIENCYRYNGIDHCISKQAYKLEVILEQKLALLSR